MVLGVLCQHICGRGIEGTYGWHAPVSIGQHLREEGSPYVRKKLDNLSIIYSTTAADNAG